MAATVALRAANLAVDPGQSATCELSIANSGTIVEQFTILVIGDTADWTTPDPPVVSLFPGAQQTVTLRFAPPRAPTTPAGEVSFAVKVIPSNEPEESVVEEGVVSVGSFTDVDAELLPRVATGRVAGRQRVAVDSRGNTPVLVAISALDAADALKFRLRPSKVTVPPGQARFVKVRVKPLQRFWRGPPQQKPFNVQAAPEGEKPIVLNGALNQKPVLPKWLLPLLAALAALVLLWFFVLRPYVHSTAINATAPALAAQRASTNALAGRLAATQSAVAANKAALAKLAATTTTTTVAPTTTTTVPPTTTTTVPPTTTTTALPPVTGPNDGRIEVIAAPGSTSRAATAPLGTGSTMMVDDLVIQNVSGSSGRATIERLAPGRPAEDLLVENLATLSDQEYRFDSPIEFTAGQQLALSVDCLADQPACDVGIYFTGPLTQPQPTTTTTEPPP